MTWEGTPISGEDHRYGTSAELRNGTGVEAQDLTSGDEVALEGLLDRWLAEATEYVDAYLEKTYDPAVVPVGIKGITLRIASNMVMVALQRRNTPIIQVSDFNFQLVKDEVMTKSIREDLELFKSADEGKRRSPLAIGIANRLTRVEE